jgi:3'-5' exonuclease
MDKAYLSSILFLDIETVSCCEDFDSLDERMKPLWDKKAAYMIRDQEITASKIYEERAAIYAEFGKVICIGIGYLNFTGNGTELRIKNISGDNEKLILQEFKELLDKKFNRGNQLLCAHNGKEFDFPYLCRRFLINGMTPPSLLDISAMKPWEVPHLDTMEMWKFGDRKNYTSLELLAASLNVPTSKTDMDGSMVNNTYYKEKNLAKITHYCMRDVAVTAQIFLRMKGCQILKDEEIKFLV